MRNLADVIHEIKKLVPGDERALLHNIENVERSLHYSSPETVGLRWEQMAVCLWDNFPEEKDFDVWHKKIVNLWTDSVLFPEVIE